VENRNEAVVKLLLEQEVDSDFKESEYGQTLLYLAAENGNEAVLKLLAESDSFDPDSEDKNDETPLSWTIDSGHDRLVELLLMKHQVNGNFHGRKYENALLGAAYHVNHTLMQLLAEK
jgi:ankyrin repeat protein